MARRKKKSHQNCERWLVSYADLVTLLFAFFVVLFASTQTDKSRARQISRAVNNALESSHFETPSSSLKMQPDQVLTTPRAAEQTRAAQPTSARPTDESKKEISKISTPGDALKTSMTDLESALSAEMKQGQVAVHLEARGLVISMNAQAVFPSGGDAIGDMTYPLIAKIAATLNRIRNQIRLEGHTDSLPISNSRFRSNWELSAARSIAMLRILNERFDVSLNRMAVIGYADTNSVSNNDTEVGRTRNRRVDLVILNDFGSRAEPQISGLAN